MFKFCGKPSFIFCIFCLTEEELIHLLHARKYIAHDFFTLPASQKIKGAETSLIIEKSWMTSPFMFFILSPANHIEFFSVVSKSDMEPGCILLNINPIPIG